VTSTPAFNWSARAIFGGNEQSLQKGYIKDLMRFMAMSYLLGAMRVTSQSYRECGSEQYCKSG